MCSMKYGYGYGCINNTLSVLNMVTDIKNISEYPIVRERVRKTSFFDFLARFV